MQTKSAMCSSAEFALYGSARQQNSAMPKRGQVPRWSRSLVRPRVTKHTHATSARLARSKGFVFQSSIIRPHCPLHPPPCTPPVDSLLSNVKSWARLPSRATPSHPLLDALSAHATQSGIGPRRQRSATLVGWMHPAVAGLRCSRAQNAARQSVQPRQATLSHR